jgi:hypothetical protein
MNKILYSILSLGVGISVILNMGQAKASQLINDDQIIPMSDLMENFNDFFLEEIADGDTSNFNGFSSGSATGTIKLDLIGNFDLESFILWNDVNVLAEGIKDFQLDFFDSSDSFIESSNIFIGPLSQVEGEEYIFDTVVPDVSRVDLVVLSSYPGFGSDIEIREVAFTGNVTKTVPEPSSLISLLIIGTVNLGYLLKRKIRHT